MILTIHRTKFGRNRLIIKAWKLFPGFYIYSHFLNMLNSLKKVSLLISLVTGFVVLACNKQDEYNPNLYFSKTLQDSIVKQSIRYSAKLPPQATHETKFNSEFNGYYNKAFQEYDFRRCYPIPNDSGYYFLMTRKARSIWPAREAIGGKLKVNGTTRVTDYEEVFRTWKMTEDTLNTRAFELFELMVKGKDLEPYRSKHKGDRYIEFPDDRFYFDRTKKRWSDRLADSLRLHL
jgi:hypothetical protein